MQCAKEMDVMIHLNSKHDVCGSALFSFLECPKAVLQQQVPQGRHDGAQIYCVLIRLPLFGYLLLLLAMSIFDLFQYHYSLFKSSFLCFLFPFYYLDFLSYC